MFENPIRVPTASRVFVLCAVISAQNFLSTELSAPFIVLLGLLIMTLGKMQRSYIKLIWPLLGVLVIGIMGVSDHELRHVLRDVAYALMPISLIFIGYWIEGNRGILPLLLKVLVISGFVIALIHLNTFVQNPELLSFGANDVRKIAGGTGDLVVLAFLLGLFQKRFEINDLFPRLLPRLIVMPVLLASFVLSYSRTGLMVAIILSLSLLGWISRVNRRFVLAIAVIMVGYTAIAVVTPESEVDTFRGKIVRSVKEVTISNYQNMSDISENWRGFESHMAMEAFSSGNILQQALGKGFGALVDLGFYMPLGGRDQDSVELRYIPILHNGYMYILIKVGVLGLVCYIFFYINIIRYAVRYRQSTNSEQRFLAMLLLGCVLSLISSMYVIGGMAQVHNAEFVLLLGYIVARLRQNQTEKSCFRVVRIG